MRLHNATVDDVTKFREFFTKFTQAILAIWLTLSVVQFGFNCNETKCRRCEVDNVMELVQKLQQGNSVELHFQM